MAKDASSVFPEDGHTRIHPPPQLIIDPSLLGMALPRGVVAHMLLHQALLSREIRLRQS